jgi:hypothetical protein
MLGYKAVKTTVRSRILKDAKEENALSLSQQWSSTGTEIVAKRNGTHFQ